VSNEFCPWAEAKSKWADYYEDKLREAIEAQAELERKLGIAVKCLEFAELRFSAMCDSTINNGPPAASELIGLCNESFLRIALCIDDINAKKEGE
jgi:hypothetical protein